MESKYEKGLKSAFKKAGFVESSMIRDTLQGSIWRSVHLSTNRNVVIKATDRKLHSQSVSKCNKYLIHENIVKEKNILKYINQNKNVPNSIVKYIGFFKTNANYCLIMEDAGHSLFDFMVKAHKLIQAGKIDICEWHKVLKIILKQMIESVEYIHSKNVCHFDISLENFVINDVDVHLTNDGKIRFSAQDIQVKLCDFGLSERFKTNSDFTSTKRCGKTNYKSPELVQNRRFCAKKNDIWCLGVCIFMLMIGGSPWFKASYSDNRFVQLMQQNGIKYALILWDRLEYVNDNLIDLIKTIFQSEKKRCSIQQIKQSPFLQR